MTGLASRKGAKAQRREERPAKHANRREYDCIEAAGVDTRNSLYASSFAPIRVYRGQPFLLFFVFLCAFAPLREALKTQAQEPTPASPQEEPQLEPAPEDPLTPAPLDGLDGRPLAIDQFRPKSMLELPEHRPLRAKFPTVDVHTHMRHKLRQTPEA